MTIPTITPLPTAPARTDPPATFITRADSFLAAMVTMQTELNTTIGSMNTDIAGVNSNVIAAQAAQTGAETAETNAEAAQSAAESAANATLWVSGTSYSAGDVVYSPTTYFSYRANTSFTSNTDPASDAVNWVALTASGGGATVELVATGTIDAAGVTVALKSDGTVEQVSHTGQPDSTGAITLTGINTVNGNEGFYATYDATSDTVVATWKEGTNAYAVAASISGSTLTFGTVTNIKNGNVYSVRGIASVVCSNDANETRVVVGWFSINKYLSTLSLLISGTTITSYDLRDLTSYISNPTAADSQLVSCPEDQSLCFLHVDSHNTRRLDAWKITITTSGILANQAVDNVNNAYTQQGGYYKWAIWDGTYVRVIYGNNSANRVETRSLTPNATGYSVGGINVPDFGYSSAAGIEWNPIDSKFIMYGNNKICTATQSGANATFGTAVDFTAILSEFTYPKLIYSAISEKIYIVGRKYIAPNYYLIKKQLPISGTDITLTSPYIFSDPVTGYNPQQLNWLESSSQAFEVNIISSSEIGYYPDFPSTLVTNAGNFIGFAQGAGTDGNPVDVSTDYMIDANQTSLTPKTTYYVDYDGSITDSATIYPIAGYALNDTTIQVSKS